MPTLHLSPAVVLHAQRLIAADWTNAIIAKILVRTYRLPLTAQCVKNIRTGTPCSPKCSGQCRP